MPPKEATIPIVIRQAIVCVEFLISGAAHNGPNTAHEHAPVERQLLPPLASSDPNWDDTVVHCDPRYDAFT